MVRTIKEGDGQMKYEELMDDDSQYYELGPIAILAKAILLDKVSIKQGKIIVKPFDYDEV
jgi:hypothetical protein